MKACHHISRHRRPSLKCVLKYYIQKPLKYVVSMTIVTTGFLLSYTSLLKAYILFSMIRIVTVNGYDHRYILI